MHEQKLQVQEQIDSNLARPIGYGFLIKFTLPTIISFLIMGVFGIVDGVFAARGISQEALGAINFVMPFFTFTMAIGLMLSMGGSALVAKKKGEYLTQEARENFTLITLATFISSVVLSLFSWFFREPLLRLLGTDESVFDLALTYLQPLILTMPFIMLGLLLVQFLIAEGRPVLGMIASSSGAIVSTALNVLFILILEIGVVGLALATGIGYAVPAVLGLIYFTYNRKGTIYFVCPKWDAYVLGRSSLNGISEAITMMATTVTSIVMNNVLVRIVGWEGVAAAGIVIAAQGIFSSLFYGYSAGIAPVISYNFGRKKAYIAGELRGEEEQENLKKLYQKSLVIVTVLSAIALVATLLLADFLVRVYVSPHDPFMGHLHAMAMRGLRIVAIAYTLMGFNMFAAAWFTAFNDGIVSGMLSLSRTMGFLLILLITLPRIWGLDGVWLALPLAEVFGVFVTIFFFVKMGKKYYYRTDARENPQDKVYANLLEELTQKDAQIAYLQTEMMENQIKWQEEKKRHAIKRLELESLLRVYKKREKAQEAVEKLRPTHKVKVYTK